MRNYIPVKKKKATKVYLDENYIIVKLYSTEIVKLNSREVILNSGGWSTNTTKNRINQSLTENGINMSVYQDNRQWFIRYNNEDIEFVDGICIKLV